MVKIYNAMSLVCLTIKCSRCGSIRYKDVLDEMYSTSSYRKIKEEGDCIEGEKYQYPNYKYHIDCYAHGCSHPDFITLIGRILKFIFTLGGIPIKGYGEIIDEKIISQSQVVEWPSPFAWEQPKKKRKRKRKK